MPAITLSLAQVTEVLNEYVQCGHNPKHLYLLTVEDAEWDYSAIRYTKEEEARYLEQHREYHAAIHTGDYNLAEEIRMCFLEQ